MSTVLAVLLLSTVAVADVPKPVEVRVVADRTAVWIGDRVVYTVELRCAPDVDVVLDDLNKDRIRVNGGEMLDAIDDHQESGGGRIRRMRYTLTTYRVDAPEIRIDPFTVRYFSRRNLDAAAQATPAGQVTVPATVIAIRSTLPDSGKLPELRQPAAGRQLPAYLRYAQPVGLGLIALAILPTLIVALNVAGHARAAWAKRAVRRGRREQRVSFDQLKQLDPSTDADRVRAYEQLDAVVREHIRLATNVPAQALTPAELRAALAQRAPGFASDEVEALLQRCERVRYAPDPPPRDAWGESLRTAAEVLGRRR